MCGNICLDHSGSDLMSRVANRVYDHCRSGVLSLPGFPNFDPIIQALKQNQTSDRQKNYRVSLQAGDRLVILQSLAQKWVDTESTKERALEVILEHNKLYNQDGKYWHEERILFLVKLDLGYDTFGSVDGLVRACHMHPAMEIDSL